MPDENAATPDIHELSQKIRSAISDVLDEIVKATTSTKHIAPSEAKSWADTAAALAQAHHSVLH